MLGFLLPTEHCLNVMVYPSFLLLTMSISCSYLLNSDFTVLKRLPQSPYLSPIEHFMYVVVFCFFLKKKLYRWIKKVINVFSF